MKPILFHIGPIPVFTYGFMLACALAIALPGVHWLSKKREMPSQLAADGLFWSFAGGLIGGRLYYIAFHLPYYREHFVEIFYLHQGGLTWYGALAGSLLTLWIYSRSLRMSMSELTDVYAPFMALGQSIGRIGCFFNGCCGGLLKADESGQIYRIPVQLYESAAMLLAAILTLTVFFKTKKIGITTCCYLLLQGSVRFVSEFYRDNQPLAGMLTHAQIISLFLTAAALIWISMINLKNHAKTN